MKNVLHNNDHNIILTSFGPDVAEEEMIKRATEMFPKKKLHLVELSDTPDNLCDYIITDDGEFVFASSKQEARILDQVKGKRNELLNISDKWVIEDYPRGDATLDEVKQYRQELRELPIKIKLKGIKSLTQALAQFPSKPL